MDVQYPVPCCYYDGRPCWEQWCEYIDLEAAKQACINDGGCPGPWGPSAACADWDCDGIASVSCCDLTDGACYNVSADVCYTQYNGKPICPAGCEAESQFTCEQLATETFVCCLPMYPYCQVLTYAECESLNGVTLWHATECSEFVCGVGCRPPLEPVMPTDGPAWGSKRYTTDICYAVPMVRTKKPLSHGGASCRGRGVPVTAHEVRAVAQTGDDDPCALAYGVTARDSRGRRRPYICSDPDHRSTEYAGYSRGYFCKSVDNDGPIRRGRRFRKAGVLTEPTREVRYLHPQLICGGTL